MDTDTLIKDFFLQYATRLNETLKGHPVDAEEAASCFADFFVQADPNGVLGGKNDETLREAIPKGWEHYKALGFNNIVLRSCEISRLNSMHAVARIQWQFFYEKKGVPGEINFEIAYFVQVRENRCRIFGFVIEDENKALKEHGLV